MNKIAAYNQILSQHPLWTKLANEGRPGVTNSQLLGATTAVPGALVGGHLGALGGITASSLGGYALSQSGNKSLRALGHAMSNRAPEIGMAGGVAGALSGGVAGYRGGKGLGQYMGLDS